MAAPPSTANPALTVPAAMPLIIAVSTGSADDNFRVRLLSMPQARQAAAISAAPVSTSTPRPPQERIAAPARIAKAPSSSLPSTFSRKTSQANAHREETLQIEQQRARGGVRARQAEH